jgi:hypothetical protein
LKREPFGELANNNSPTKFNKTALKQTSPFKSVQEQEKRSDRQDDKRTPESDNF